MKDSEHIATGLLTAADGLRQLILDNTGLPLLVFAGEDANKCPARIGTRFSV